MMNYSRLEKRIIRETMNTFRIYGIKYALIDTIASALHISKRTLYEHFPSKEELLNRCILYEMDKMKDEISNLRDDCSSCLELIIEADDVCFRQIHSFCPNFYIDMRQYQEIQAIVNKEFRSWIYSMYTDACNHAIEYGYIVPKCNLQFMFAFLEANLRISYMNRNLYSMEELSDIHRYTIRTYLAGVCTDYGRILLVELAEK